VIQTKDPDSNAIFQLKGYVSKKVLRQKADFYGVHKMSWQCGSMVSKL
jgi:hypothetical protein